MYVGKHGVGKGVSPEMEEPTYPYLGKGDLLGITMIDDPILRARVCAKWPVICQEEVPPSIWDPIYGTIESAAEKAGEIVSRTTEAAVGGIARGAGNLILILGAVGLVIFFSGRRR